MSNSNSTIPSGKVGEIVIDCLTTATPDQLQCDRMLGELVMSNLRRAGMRVAWDDTVPGADDPTEQLPALDLPLAVRVHQAMDLDSGLELTDPSPTGTIMMLERQAE